jgi:hypothetical protein
MSFHYHPAIGTFHLNEAAPRRVVPCHERHKWDSKQVRGQFSTCVKCGCTRMYNRDYSVYYRANAASLPTEMRPPCTGPAAPAPPPELPVSAANAGPDAARATPYPTSLPGLTTTYDEQAPYYHLKKSD